MKKLFYVLTLISYVFALREKSLHYITDAVRGGSYRYYSLMYDGFIKIKLVSQSGDADLYISQTTNVPTYDPDRYCLQSTTCGDDIVIIPDSFKRPVSIGIYGHPSHEISQYILSVYSLKSNGDTSYEQRSENFNDDYESEDPEISLTASLTLYLLKVLFQILF